MADEGNRAEVVAEAFHAAHEAQLDHDLDACAEMVAQAFHEAYERLAPEHGYKTRKASAVPWEKVPVENQALMVAVARELLERRVIAPQPEVPTLTAAARQLLDAGTIIDGGSRVLGFPYQDDDKMVLGPDCVIGLDHRVISWRGQDYVAPASMTAPPSE